MMKFNHGGLAQRHKTHVGQLLLLLFRHSAKSLDAQEERMATSL